MKKEISELIKKDYINQLRTIYSNDSVLCRNLDKVSTCKVFQDSALGVGANSDLGNNKIMLGDYADEVTLFHELDHVRKGKLNYTIDASLYITSNNEAKFEDLRRGIFFDEAITEFIAQYMFKHSPYYQPNIDKVKILSRNFYQKQIDVLTKLADAIGVSPLSLCAMIDKRHNNGDIQIDKKLEGITGDKNTFIQIETLLDYYGTAQYISYQCSLGAIKNPQTGEVIGKLTDKVAKDSEIAFGSAEKMIIDVNRIRINSLTR